MKKYCPTCGRRMRQIRVTNFLANDGSVLRKAYVWRCKTDGVFENLPVQTHMTTLVDAAYNFKLFRWRKLTRRIFRGDFSDGEDAFDG